MIPFYFGTGSRRLFGIHSVARAAAALRPGRAALLCHPWGPEYQYSYRSMKHLADGLSEAGIHVLRFDYIGTGDSDGDSSDFGLSEATRDIEAAIEELKDAAAVTRVSLVGLRLGALLAARVASSSSSHVERVVLWDPVVSGEHYLQELIEHQDHAPCVIEGFPVTETLAAEIQAAHLAQALQGFSGRALVVTSVPGTLEQDVPALARAQKPSSFSIEHIEGTPVWHPERGLGVGAIPVALVTRVIEWLSQ
jgi:pimeloyl-ACP methyl ester carboxylesterase